MLGISFPELLIILLALFLIVGPKRMAESAYEIGKWIRRIRTELYHLKQTHLQDLDVSTFYEAKTELNKSLSDLARPQDSNSDTSDKKLHDPKQS